MLDKVQKLNITPPVKAALIQAAVAILIFGLGAKFGNSRLIFNGADRVATTPSLLNVEEFRQFDLFMQQYRAADFNVANSYKMLEFIDMKAAALNQSDSSGEEKIVRESLKGAYRTLGEAYQARMDALNKVASENTMGAATAMAKANAKSESSCLRFLMGLLAYDHSCQKRSVRTAEIQPLISKYRNITGFQGNYTED